MKVYIWPTFSKQERGEGGIRRVVEALYRWLPEYGVDLVGKVSDADLINVHADEYVTDLPVAASLHGLYWSGYSWADWCYVANQRLIRVAKKADSVSVPSDWVRNAMARGMLLNPFVLKHGIEINEWEPKETEGYVFWGKTRPDPVCDPAPVQKLAQLIPDIQFVSTFGNSDISNMSVVGKKTYIEAKDLIQKAGVYLATVMETGGITVLEAMASGVPPLAFNWGVNPELIVHKETGYLVDPDDEYGLIDGLRYCIEHRERLGTAAREYVKDNHDWKTRVGDYLPFFQAALDSSAPRPVKISVVVTAYNLEKYLRGCLDSILAQDINDVWECIIVDDNSPDACGLIADEYASRDGRFKVIHNTRNRYLAEARNVGFRAARGEYFLALDADDQLSPQSLRMLAASLDKDRGLDIATGGFELVEPDGRHWQSGWPTSNPNTEDQIRGRNQVPYASLYRRWVWERTGGYRRRHRTAEDADFWLRAVSYGARMGRTMEVPSLIYSNRPGSMSNSVPMVDWTAWHSGSRYPSLIPFGAAAGSDEKFYARHVDAYGPVDVSVVIPCGPDHDFLLQDALDSLVAQTFTRWEAIVVNDTGRSWFDKNGKLINPYLAGYPFVRIIEPYDLKKRGVAYARNVGAHAAASPLIVFLDADDFMQPLMLDILIKTYDVYGGWVYPDWYDQDGNHKEAQPWNSRELIRKMLGPITGLYRKSDFLAVGGFDINAPGWEDWDFQLRLLEHGVCGTRVAQPLFTYRYQTGTRREDGFSRAKEVLQYIKDQHPRLIHDEEFIMACGKCGGGGGSATVSVGFGGSPAVESSMVLIEYTGPAAQKMTLSSRVKAGRKYRFGGPPGDPGRKFYVYEGDVPFFTANTFFRKVDTPPTSVRVPTEMPSPIKAETMERSPEDEPLDVLPLAPEVRTILAGAGLMTVGQLKQMSIIDLVQIKGMGKARARRVQDVVAAHS